MNTESEQKIIDEAISYLKRGSVILYPADTIWGIGCDAEDTQAIRKVYDIKGRSYDKPLIVLVSSIAQLYQVVDSVHPRIDTLLTLHERPLTIIYPQASAPFRHLAAENGSIGVRVVRSGFCHNLIETYGKPLVSTSANISSAPSPTTFGTISFEVINQVDYALPASTEKDMSGMPSVIAKYDANGELDFLRTA